MFLVQCREKGIKLNVDKLKLRQREVSYIRHLLTSDGLKIDPDKVQALTRMPKPTDAKGVQRLLGIVNYLSKIFQTRNTRNKSAYTLLSFRCRRMAREEGQKECVLAGNEHADQSVSTTM